MLKDIFQDTRHGFHILIAVIILLLALGLIIVFTIQSTSKANEEKAESVISAWNEISSEENDKEFAALLNLSFLPEETIGDIYTYLAHNSYLFEDKMIYNNYVGAASFYYDKANAKDKTVQLFSGYIGRLYENGGFEACTKVFESVESEIDVMNIANKTSAIEFYLGYADVEEMLGNTEKASKILTSLKTLMAQSKDNNVINKLKYEMLYARNQLLMGNISETEKILKEYKETDTFGMSSKNQNLLVNYVLPNYELRGKILLLKGDLEGAKVYIDKYIGICTDCNFYSLELRMYDYILNNTNSTGSTLRDQYKQSSQSLMHSMLNFTSEDYCDVLLQNLKDVYAVENSKYMQQQRLHQGIKIGYIGLFVIAILLYLVHFAYFYTNTDELTHLRNRKLYAARCHYMAKHEKSHYVIIFDIDDFKLVNDTYGHQAGDEVLRTVGYIIRQNISANSQAFRYGGEELCIMSLIQSEDKCFNAAEKIRKEVLEYPWKNNMNITVSGGIAKSHQGEYAFDNADVQMYRSKELGKNRVSM